MMEAVLTNVRPHHLHALLVLSNYSLSIHIISSYKFTLVYSRPLSKHLIVIAHR